MVLAFWEEAQDLEERMIALNKELAGIAREHPVISTLLQIPGIGVLTATALYASIGNIHLFQSGRHLASWLGITPREHSSGNRRRMGRISKQGDRYLRTLLIHGARSALTAAQVRQRSGKPLTRIQQWAVEKADNLRHSNQAAVALARSPVHASRAASQAGQNMLGGVEAREAFRRQLSAPGCLTRHLRRTATTHHGNGPGGTHRGSASRDTMHLMAERSVRRRDKADNPSVP